MPADSPSSGYDFSGKTVLVTGSSQGIGAAIARRFAAFGARLVAHYRSHRAEMEAVVSDIESTGGVVSPLEAELTDPDRVRALLQETVESTGGLHVLVNNAGIYPNAELLDMSPEAWKAMFAANVDSVLYASQAAARHMKDHGGGVIINIASISALHPAPAHAHYNAAKAAVLALTRSAAQELGPAGIRVNAVSPGLIARAGLEEAWPEGVRSYQERSPLGSIGEPEDVANACLFLASPLARWITGANLVVDGGMTAASLY